MVLPNEMPFVAQSLILSCQTLHDELFITQLGKLLDAEVCIMKFNISPCKGIILTKSRSDMRRLGSSREALCDEIVCHNNVYAMNISSRS